MGNLAEIHQATSIMGIKSNLLLDRRPWLLQARMQFILLTIVVLLAAFHRLWLVDGAFNNFMIFRYSFSNLYHGIDLYAPHPEQYFDLYKYSPTFAVFMAPFQLLPVSIGAILWSLLNAWLPFIAIQRLDIAQRWKTFLFFFIIIELITSIQNAQSNGLMTGLIILAFTAFERKQIGYAALFIALGVFIKLFAAAAAILFIFYDKKWRFILAGIFWSIVLISLPLLFTSPDMLIQHYKSWMHLLRNDPAHELNYSIMTLSERLFGIYINDLWYLVPGVILLLLPLLRHRYWFNSSFRLLTLAGILIWVVIFNHKAESPTFIIAITGIGLWATTEPDTFRRRGLLILAFVIISLSPTDLFPLFIRRDFFVQYALKALPAVVIWLYIVWKQLLGKYFAEQPLIK